MKGLKSLADKKKKVYAIKEGRVTGIVKTWDECQASVKGYSGAVYKSFTDEKEAIQWLNNKGEISSDDESEFMDVYTDGSFVNGQYSWAYVFVQGDQIVCEDKGLGKNTDAASMRNVAGELAAVLYAVRQAVKMGVKIRIHHDYAGIAFWVTGEWKAQNEYTKKYVELMNQYKGNFTFKKVAAHTGYKFNEYVDQRAKEALGIEK